MHILPVVCVCFVCADGRLSVLRSSSPGTSNRMNTVVDAAADSVVELDDPDFRKRQTERETILHSLL